MPSTARCGYTWFVTFGCADISTRRNGIILGGTLPVTYNKDLQRVEDELFIVCRLSDCSDEAEAVDSLSVSLIKPCLGAHRVYTRVRWQLLIILYFILYQLLPRRTRLFTSSSPTIWCVSITHLKAAC